MSDPRDHRHILRRTPNLPAVPPSVIPLRSKFLNPAGITTRPALFSVRLLEAVPLRARRRRNARRYQRAHHRLLHPFTSIHAPILSKDDKMASKSIPAISIQS